MPPLISKSKPKGKEQRQSRSRNTTPSSSVSAPLTSTTPSHTAFLELSVSNLMVPTNITYENVIDRHGGGGGIPDPAHLETISNDLKTLAQLANARSDANTKGMRELADRRKQLVDEQIKRERERTRSQADEDRKSLKREAEDDDEGDPKVGRPRKKKEKSVAREERPLNHGAHGLARQDGLDLPLEASPGNSIKLGNSPKAKRELSRATSSPLTEASAVASPSTAPIASVQSLKAPTPESEDSADGHQPPPAPAQPHYQTFGDNPLKFDDPTIYEIRPVTDEMTEEEKKEIYCVASYPHDDLSHLIAGTPPNKDFSNAVKPNNQVQAHTFASYLDGYLRDFKEEDIGFLNERGDRVGALSMPARGSRHYTEVWAEEDGSMALDMPQDRLPSNQARGSLEDMDDDVAETDQVSSGPLTSRLLSTLRFEDRAPQTDDKPQTNGVTSNTDTVMTNGDLPNGIHHENESSQDAGSKPATIPSATALPEGTRSSANNSNLSHSQLDDRLKAELRHIGFLSADDEPDYDRHDDDEVAERLRWLQARLREVSVLNGARKRRVLQLAEEQLAFQEYKTILDDLDNQVQQAYLKRARTAGKSKKNAKRPGGAAGSLANGGAVNGVAGAISKPGIGDLARQLMNRRARWEEKIGPVFNGDVRRVRGKGEGIFGEREMEALVRMERDMFDEDTE